MGLLSRLLSHTPLVRYIKAVERGIAQQDEAIEERAIITDIHAKRANYYFFEKNHVTPLVTALIRGESTR